MERSLRPGSPGQLDAISSEENGELDHDFDFEEVQEAVKALNYHKAAAEDGTKNPMYKCGGDFMVELLGKLFNFLKLKEMTPADWSRSVVVNLYKDGDRTDPSNYRGIALISCLGKLYLSLWTRRITKHMEDRLSEEQGGFRPKRSTVDQALTLREALLHRHRQGVPTYLYFVDFKKAFDTVWLDGLWTRMHDEGIRGKALRIIMNLYNHVCSQVRVGDRLTREVRMLQGVRQGCPLSPALFNIFIDELARRINAAEPEDAGIRIGERLLRCLLYADDVVILAESPKELQQFINIVDQFCSDWHMNVNLKKSNVMVVGHPDCECEEHASACREGCGCATCAQWTSHGQRLTTVRMYKYLGIWFNDNLLWNDHLKYMLPKAVGKSNTIRGLLTNNRITPRAKLLVWFAFVRPLLDYGCEVWNTDSKSSAALESVQTQAGALIFKLNTKTNQHAIRALMKCTSLESRRARYRLRYLAKLWSMPEENLARVAIEAQPSAKVRRGRGHKHWKTQLEDLIKTEPSLKQAHQHLSEALSKFAGQLPASKDYSLVGDEEEDPVKDFHDAVEDWIWGTEAAAMQTEGTRARSTLSTMAFILRDVQWPYLIPLTRRPNLGPNQIRLRLLTGTSALWSTLAKYRELGGGGREEGGGRDEPRNKQCPHGCKTTEDAAHFFLHCNAYSQPRAEFWDSIRLHKIVLPCGRTIACDNFFQRLDDAGKVAFMLGGPIEGLAIEWKIDHLSEKFVLAAYKLRSERLEQDNSNGTASNQQRELARNDIRNYFQAARVAEALSACQVSASPCSTEYSTGESVGGTSAPVTVRIHTLERTLHDAVATGCDIGDAGGGAGGVSYVSGGGGGGGGSGSGGGGGGGGAAASASAAAAAATMNARPARSGSYGLPAAERI